MNAHCNDGFCIKYIISIMIFFLHLSDETIIIRHNALTQLYNVVLNDVFTFTQRKSSRTISVFVTVIGICIFKRSHIRYWSVGHGLKNLSFSIIQVLIHKIILFVEIYFLQYTMMHSFLNDASCNSKHINKTNFLSMVHDVQPFIHGTHAKSHLSR